MGVPAPVESGAAAVFGALSRLRGSRIFHPVGVGYRATVEVSSAPGAYHGVDLLEPGSSHQAVVRFSRGAGLPERLPDVLGLAVRVLDLYGDGRHQDFLLASSGRRPLGRHLLLPGTAGFFAQPFSSLLLYRVAGRVRVVGAMAAARPDSVEGGSLGDLSAAADVAPLRFRLMLASPAGPWEHVAVLRTGARLSDADTEAIRFNPWQTGGGIRPVGPLMGLRRAAYLGSQEGRAHGVPDPTA